MRSKASARHTSTGREITITAAAADGRLRAGTVFMDEPLVMATENALLAAALTPASPPSATRV